MLLGALIWKANQGRPTLKLDEELIPNQLLTTHPVVFLSGRKSIFYFLKYWNKLPERLREHGHDVSELLLPWRDTDRSTHQIVKLLKGLEEKNKKVHIFADTTRMAELRFLSCSHLSSIQSLNVICRPMDEPIASTGLTPTPLAIQRHIYSFTHPSASNLSLWLVKLHQILHSFHNFDPEILGVTVEQRTHEQFYLQVLSELAASDLKGL